MTATTAHCTTISPCAAPSHSRALRTRSLFSRLFGLLDQSAALARQRRDLAALDDKMLRDIGVTRSQAMQEATRPFWDAPRHWRG